MERWWGAIEQSPKSRSQRAARKTNASPSRRRTSESESESGSSDGPVSYCVVAGVGAAEGLFQELGSMVDKVRRCGAPRRTFPCFERFLGKSRWTETAGYAIFKLLHNIISCSSHVHADAASSPLPSESPSLAFSSPRRSSLGRQAVLTAGPPTAARRSLIAYL